MNILFAIACTLIVAVTTSVNDVAGTPSAAAIDYPRYAYSYAVNDPFTKDNKAQWETRDGDVVTGSYSLIDPDGTLRIVNYHSDGHAGFNAEVKKIGPSIHTPHRANIEAVHNPAPIVPNIEQVIPYPIVRNIRPVLHAPLVAKTVTPLSSIIGPGSYGFGATPIVANLPKLTTVGKWSLPWDPLTRSYGGWKPIVGPLLPHTPYATIFSKRFKGNYVHNWVTGPLPLNGNTLILKKHYR